MRGTLFTPDGAFVIWIRDISTSGALVCSPPPGVGSYGTPSAVVTNAVVLSGSSA